jgi:hypothetical protein
MMKKIRIIQQEFNEVDYKNEPTISPINKECILNFYLAKSR